MKNPTKNFKYAILVIISILLMTMQSYLPVSAATIPGTTITSVKKNSVNKVKVTWKNSKSQSYKFEIWRSTTSSTKGYKKLKDLPTGTTSYTDSSAVPGKNNYYRVRAYSLKNGQRVYGRLSVPKSYKLGKPTVKPTLGYYCNNADGGGYWINVSNYSGGYVTLQIGYSTMTFETVTRKMKVPVVGNNCRFNWDSGYSGSSKGTGTVVFGSNAVKVTMKESYHNPWDRVSLSQNGYKVKRLKNAFK